MLKLNSSTGSRRNGRSFLKLTILMLYIDALQTNQRDGFDSKFQMVALNDAVNTIFELNKVQSVTEQKKNHLNKWSQFSNIHEKSSRNQSIRRPITILMMNTNFPLAAKALKVYSSIYLNGIVVRNTMIVENHYHYGCACLLLVFGHFSISILRSMLSVYLSCVRLCTRPFPFKMYLK